MIKEHPTYHNSPRPNLFYRCVDRLASKTDAQDDITKAAMMLFYWMSVASLFLKIAVWIGKSL